MLREKVNIFFVIKYLFLYRRKQLKKKIPYLRKYPLLAKPHSTVTENGKEKPLTLRSVPFFQLMSYLKIVLYPQKKIAALQAEYIELSMAESAQCLVSFYVIPFSYNICITIYFDLIFFFFWVIM